MKLTEQEMRELDAWIAEHVMGWVWWHLPKTDPKHFTPETGICKLIRSDENWPAHKHWQGKRIAVPMENVKQDVDVPRYTTDPAAAMEVLKKCGFHKNNAIQIYCLRAEENRDGKESFWINDPRLEANTLELAIALFANKLFSK